MENVLPLVLFSRIGGVLLFFLLVVSGLMGCISVAGLIRPGDRSDHWLRRLLPMLLFFFGAGFVWICWFHLQMAGKLVLELPPGAGEWLNRQAGLARSGLPPYDPAAPPRYTVPVWIEAEKYYFWFFCSGLMAFWSMRGLARPRFRAALCLLVSVQTGLLFFLDPFSEPLPRLLSEVAPWFAAPSSGTGERLGLFMQLYPKLVHYYNASYMWLHPPMLFLAYAGITITFVASCFMLGQRDPALERAGYNAAKLAYLMLTLGMLLGYPWALAAWGPNWWWDPKICSSLMMWALFSTYFHTRLYANKPAMWYFSSLLGIVCYLAMLFTFLTSFFFPGEHTFQ